MIALEDEKYARLQKLCREIISIIQNCLRAKGKKGINTKFFALTVESVFPKGEEESWLIGC